MRRALLHRVQEHNRVLPLGHRHAHIIRARQAFAEPRQLMIMRGDEATAAYGIVQMFENGPRD
jgi:hypothetical protein